MQPYLKQLAANRRSHVPRGIYSVCSAHPWVLRAAMQRHPDNAGPLLIEATCNQVNQFGGYTGMLPEDFRQLVHRIARETGFAQERILLGGDHLGPFPWQALAAGQAMQNACDLVRAYVLAGYTKIHLDTSMGCADDPKPPPDAVIAERAARLCAAAEEAAPAPEQLVYIIGTEVPTPGGAAAALDMPVTTPDDAGQALTLHRIAFHARGLDAAWERVVALVVQPGVEFGNDTVEDYEPARARELSALLDQRPGLMFEAHSTDYQQPEALAALVRDGFTILKVGPGLTYAMRQALFALEAMEQELVPADQCSGMSERLEQAMLAHPVHWAKHYPGTPDQQRLLRMHSYSDRIRYYWTEPAVQAAVEHLMQNLSSMQIPATLLSDWMPAQYASVRGGSLANTPLALVLDATAAALDPYVAACAG